MNTLNFITDTIRILTTIAIFMVVDIVIKTIWKRINIPKIKSKTMKKIKKSIMGEKLTEYVKWEFECPHCHKDFPDEIYSNCSTKVRCSLCGNYIELIFENEEK
jgi:transposase-like protein